MSQLRFCCVTLAALLLSVAADAVTIHVPGDQTTIQAGINAASSGDTVLVACGTYYEHDIIMRPGVSIVSETGQPDCVTVDALQLGRVFHCQAAGSTTTLTGLTITGGYCIGGSGPCGAGLLCISASPRVVNCIFKENDVVGHGGALDCRDSSSGEFIDCLFTGNSSTQKGGAVRCYHSSPSFENCRFEENSGDCGGALYCSVGSPSLINCVFEENTVPGDGGAVRCFDHSNPYFDSCSFVGNEAKWGGGLACNASCSPLMVACTFFGNGASTTGSALDCYDSSPPTLYRCILALGTSGGAVFVDGTDSTPTFTCSDIYGNAGGDWDWPISGQLGLNGNISEDPLFCSETGRYLDLCEDSPCLPENHPAGPGTCDLIGAFGVGCGPCGNVAVESMSWGAIKSLYR